jgi:acyl dehydratase
MPLDPAYLLGLPPRVNRHAYSERDTMLYALGVGAGADPGELRYVYEEGLIALPTMAVVLAYPGFWQKEPQYGIDWMRVLHGEQSVTLHAPLPVAGEVIGEMTIESIVDKGRGKGALLTSCRQVRNASSGELLATVRQLSFLRGDGGCGGPSSAASQPHPVPLSAPDAELTLPTRPEQALIYRLSGDYNPLHADPKVAEEANLAAPILHGLCTYGIAGRALARLLCSGEATRLRRIDCRFTSPVFPGETIRVSVWREASGRAAFRAVSDERGVVVLSNGYAEFEE